MNLSPEKLKLYERLYEEEWAAMRVGKPLPAELQNMEELKQYRRWRMEAKELPEGQRQGEAYMAKVRAREAAAPATQMS